MKNIFQINQQNVYFNFLILIFYNFIFLFVASKVRKQAEELFQKYSNLIYLQEREDFLEKMKDITNE